MSLENFLENIQTCEGDIKINNLSNSAFTSVIENVVEPFYSKVGKDNKVSNFIEDKDMLFKLKIKQTSFALKFLTQDFKSIENELNKIVSAHHHIKLRIAHFIPYFFDWSNLLLAWLSPKCSKKDICRWKNKILKIYSYLSYGHANYDLQLSLETINKVVKLDTQKNDNEHNNIENLDLKSVDLKKIDNMHVKDEHKISAEEFLKNAEVDEDFLIEISELEKDLHETIYLNEGFNENLVASLVVFIFKYAKLLGGFSEFKELAFAINSLVNILEKAKFNEDEKRDKKIMLFLNAMIEDLINWKKVIFETSETSDIHYLDASLFSSCAQLEVLLTSKQEESNGSENDDNIGIELF